MPIIYNLPNEAYQYRYIAFTVTNPHHQVFVYAHNDYKTLTSLVTEWWIKSNYQFVCSILESKNIKQG